MGLLFSIKKIAKLDFFGMEQGTPTNCTKNPYCAIPHFEGLDQTRNNHHHKNKVLTILIKMAVNKVIAILILVGGLLRLIHLAIIAHRLYFLKLIYLTIILNMGRQIFQMHNLKGGTSCSICFEHWLQKYIFHS